jgi:hypothetical protein
MSDKDQAGLKPQGLLQLEDAIKNARASCYPPGESGEKIMR